MNTILNEWGHLIARICLSALFLISGVQFLLGWSGTVAFVGSFVPMAAVVTAIVIAIKLLGGLSVLLGYKIEWGAWALIIFTVLTIAVVHNNMADLVQALKNLGIIGGLLMLVIHGAGPKALGSMKMKMQSAAPESPVM